MKILKIICLSLFVALALIAIPGASAQTLENGAIHGTVLDTSKSVVPGAKLTLTNPSTGVRRELTSGTQGEYTFENVPPGEYTLTVDAPNFALTTVKRIVVNVGASFTVDVTLQLKTQSQTVEVTASENAAIDTSTSGVTQLLNQTDVQNLPFPGRDYRDLAQLSPSAQVVPGLRGGIRLGGQQSDYSGLMVDGSDTTNNFFGENFGSLETKNLTIPLEAVQEFQVVTNGFAPEFGRASGGLLNVVTKSGTNEVHGEAHEYYRGGSLTATDALGNPSNINSQNQFGGSIGFPIHKDRQFLFLSTDVQRENGPLITNFCPPGSASNCQALLQAEQGPIIGPSSGGGDELPAACGGAGSIGKHLLPACYGVANLAAFEGTNTQFADFFTLLGHYDYQITPANHFSIRGFGTRNHTSGFTDGRGQTETTAAFGNTEQYVNQGISGVFALTTVLGQKVNELRVSVEGETRKRHPNSPGEPEIQIQGIGIWGQRFFLPGNNDNGKLQGSDNFSYSFGKHDMKWGGDVDAFVDRKDIFAGWSSGTYSFNSLCDFDPANTANCAGVAAPPVISSPSAFDQGFGLNGVGVFPANTLFPDYQVGLGMYWQDKWQLTPRLTLTYGLRWDATWNPQPQSVIAGRDVWVGEGLPGHGSKEISVPQRFPNDFGQWGPRVGVAYNMGGTSQPTVLRAAWGYYYAQTPTIFFPTIGTSKQATLFAEPAFFNMPPSGFPYEFPQTLNVSASQLCALAVPAVGCPGITYVDPAFRNPRVSNLTVGVEHTFLNNWTVAANYVFTHSTQLRTGGFSTTQWSRNFEPAGVDQFGRTLLLAQNEASCPTTGALLFTGFQPLDCSLFSMNELGSFGHGNYHEFVASVNKRFSHRYQFFASYTWSRNYANESSERDTDTFFGPQDPFNLNLDYGRDGLDITHQFKAGIVANLPMGFTWSSNFVAHSGLAYPVYLQESTALGSQDINGDGVLNQLIGGNDRPILDINGHESLLPDYPDRQPAFFNWDMRLSKDFNFGEKYQVRLIADFFNTTNASNLYSDPDNSAFTPALACTPKGGDLVGVNCAPLTSIPKPGQPTSVGLPFRTLDQISPGATPFAFQAGVRFQF